MVPELCCDEEFGSRDAAVFDCFPTHGLGAINCSTLAFKVLPVIDFQVSKKSGGSKNENSALEIQRRTYFEPTKVP